MHPQSQPIPFVQGSQSLAKVIRRLAELGAPLRGGPSEWRTLCQNHADSSPSLWIDDGDRGVRVRCHVCPDGPEGQRQVFSALVEYSGLTPSDFFFEKRVHSGAHDTGRVITIAELAASKKLPVQLFLDQGISDSPEGVLIPYRSHWTANENDPVRIRRRLRASDTGASLWRKGDKPIIYGAWRFGQFAPEHILFASEGETDVLTGWNYDLPVIGFPGKSSPRRVLQRTPAARLAVFSRIVMIEEPDDRDDRTFERSMRRGLSDIGWQGQLCVMRLPGVKGLSELHLTNTPEGFLSKFCAAYLEAVDAEMWPEPSLGVPLLCARLAGAMLEGAIPDVFSLRELERKLPATSGELKRRLEVLAQLHWVRPLPRARTRGRPSERYRLNPKLRGIPLDR